MAFSHSPLRLIPVLWVLTLAACLPLVQRIPNGADHYFMIDVGETQVVLNNWGTLHATGYPHYVILGNIITGALTPLGVSPLIAAVIVSLVWGLLALALIYMLMAHLTGRTWLALGVTLAYALTRTVWVHFVIAEIYTFGLAILAGLLVMALWRDDEPGDDRGVGRVYWLALLGGMGVAHHRAIAMVAPALIFAVWGDLVRVPRRLPRVLGVSLLLGLLGFVPYLYLMLRARMGAAWVYGEPETWAGLWAQFAGTEAARYIGLPDSFAALAANARLINGVLLLDLTLPGLWVGVAGLMWAAVRGTQRRAAVTLLVSAGVAYGFHVLYYTDVLSALIIPITLSIAFGWLFALDGLLRYASDRIFTRVITSAAVVSLCAVLLTRNAPFIHGLVTDTRGVETIAMAERAPDGAALMLPWGPRHFAVGYARDIAGTLPHITLLDHKAAYQAPFEAGALVVPEYLQYGQYNLAWWGAQLGADVYPHTVAPDLVLLAPDVDTTTPPDALTADARLTCTADALTLQLDLTAPADGLRNLSAFAHLLDAGGAIIAQDDHPPAYGWRPSSAWQPGEIVREQLFLPRTDGGVMVRYGLYYVDDNGAIVNELVAELAAVCDG